MMKGVVVGFLVGIIVLPLAAWMYLDLGYAPVATSAPPMPLEKYFARMALHARVFREAPAQNPVARTEEHYLEGVRVYREDCAVCHGLPGQQETSVAAGMFPHPPQLFKGKGVTDDRVGETFWKVRNGIRLSGMPGFSKSLSDEQMWDVSALLADANQLPERVRQALAQSSYSDTDPHRTRTDTGQPSR